MATNYALETAKAQLAEARADVRKARAAIVKATAGDVRALSEALEIALQFESVAQDEVAACKDPRAVAERKASNQRTGYGARPGNATIVPTTKPKPSAKPVNEEYVTFLMERYGMTRKQAEKRNRDENKPGKWGNPK